MEKFQNIQPNTTADKLAWLAKSNNADICRQVAQHPNTSSERLKKLFIQFPQEVLENPILDLLLVKNPDLFTDLYYVNPNCFNFELPLFYFEWGVNNQGKLI